jgi:hypothetical protein
VKNGSAEGLKYPLPFYPLARVFSRASAAYAANSSELPACPHQPFKEKIFNNTGGNAK